MVGSSGANLEDILMQMQAEIKEAQEASKNQILESISQQRELLKCVHEAIATGTPAARRPRVVSRLPSNSSAVRKAAAPLKATQPSPMPSMDYTSILPGDVPEVWGTATSTVPGADIDRSRSDGPSSTPSGCMASAGAFSQSTRVSGTLQPRLPSTRGSVDTIVTTVSDMNVDPSSQDAKALQRHSACSSSVESRAVRSPEPSMSPDSCLVRSPDSGTLPSVPRIDAFLTRNAQKTEASDSYQRTAVMRKTIGFLTHKHKAHLKDSETFTRIVSSERFELTAALVIVTSILLIGLETDHAARNHGVSTLGYKVAGVLVFILFTVELVLRALAGGAGFLWSDKDTSWNRFDTLMVLFGLAEVVVQISGEDSDAIASDGQVFRMFKIVRIVRVLRIGRIMKYAHAFQKISYALQSSMSTLFWVMVMIVLVMSCFAIAMCQASTLHMLEFEANNVLQSPEPEYFAALRKSYSTVPDSILSLFMAITDGRGWGEFYEPLSEFSTLYAVFFLMYVSLVFFGVLNIVTAVFVDSAMQSQAYHKDLMIEDQMTLKQKYLANLKDLFNEIDADQSGQVDRDEVEYFLTDEQLKLHLDSLGINPDDARMLFQILDTDESGLVSIDEFCEGCMRLRGDAKAYDIQCLMLNTERLHQRLYEHEEHISEQLEMLGCHLGFGRTADGSQRRQASSSKKASSPKKVSSITEEPVGRSAGHVCFLAEVDEEDDHSQTAA